MKKDVCGRCKHWAEPEELELSKRSLRDLNREDLGMCGYDKSKVFIAFSDGACACFEEGESGH